MSTHASPARARRRTDIWFAIGVLVALAVLAWVVVTMQAMSHDLRISNQARDALAQQVQRLGGKPVAGAPGSRGEPGKGEVGPSGGPGVPGPTGAPGPSGSSGQSGKQGETGTGVVGDSGPSGAPGQEGPAGDVGPQGPQGDSGVAGPQGEQGLPGEKGDAGDRGPAGPACPDGYSLQPPPGDPDALECRRDDAPSDGGSGNPAGPQTAALDPSRRQYP